MLKSHLDSLNTKLKTLSSTLTQVADAELNLGDDVDVIKELQ